MSAAPRPPAPSRGTPTLGGPTAPTPAERATTGRDPFRWVMDNPGVIDAVVFGGAALLLAAMAVLSGSFAWWVPFSVPMIAAGAFLRTRTGPATLAIGILAVLHFCVGQQFVLGDVMIFYALYCATAHGSTIVRRTALGAALFGAFLQAIAFSVLAALEASGIVSILLALVGSTVFGVIAVLGTWAIGRFQYVRFEQLRLARQSAQQAAHQREQRTALAVADERARIAREMHDVVAHSLSVIIAQADGGRFVAAQSPEKAQEVLSTIGMTGRAALADMRGLLGVLRQEEETSFGPQPGIEMLDDLVDRVGSAGLSVDLHREGDLDSLPHALSLTLFRIVQEALTNAMKHGGPGTSVRVQLVRRGETLTLDVLDDGRGEASTNDGQGHGITGMRERIAAFHGDLWTGPLPAGGYRVSARIPLSPTLERTPR